jgi:hypothetical protein
MFGHKDYVSGGYSDEVMGDLSDTLFELAQGFLPGSQLAPVGDALAGALSGSIPTPFTAEPSTPSASSATVTAPNGVKLRAQPNENSAQKTMLSRGTSLTVIKTGYPPTAAAPKGWTQVRTASGVEGYVTTEWLSISTPTSSTSGNTSTSSAIVPAAPGTTTKPTTSSSSSIFDNKLLLIGGGVALVAVVAAVALGGKKKKAA